MPASLGRVFQEFVDRNGRLHVIAAENIFQRQRMARWLYSLNIGLIEFFDELQNVSDLRLEEL